MRQQLDHAAKMYYGSTIAMKLAKAVPQGVGLKVIEKMLSPIGSRPAKWIMHEYVEVIRKIRS